MVVPLLNPHVCSYARNILRRTAFFRDNDFILLHECDALYAFNLSVVLNRVYKLQNALFSFSHQHIIQIANHLSNFVGFFLQRKNVNILIGIFFILLFV